MYVFNANMNGFFFYLQKVGLLGIVNKQKDNK